MLVNHYARRWAIKPNVHDAKDLRFGMGMSSTRVSEPTRRDRLLKPSASRTRTDSLFRQSCKLYDLIPKMPEHRLALLAAAFAEAVSQASAFDGLFTQAK